MTISSTSIQERLLAFRVVKSLCARLLTLGIKLLIRDVPRGFSLLCLITASGFEAMIRCVIEIKLMSVSLLLLIKVAHVVFLRNRLERTHQLLANVLKTFLQSVSLEDLLDHWQRNLVQICEY